MTTILFLLTLFATKTAVPGEVTLAASTKKNVMELRVGGKTIRRYDISVGKKKFPTPHGTFHKVKKTFARVADWNVLLEWIKKNEAWDMFKKDVNKTAVEARMEETKTVIPGVDWVSAIDVQVRRR